MVNDYDFHTLTVDDVAKIALQRTAHLKRYPFLGRPSYKAWTKGDWGPIRREANKQRKKILHGAMQDIEAEFAVFENFIGDRPVLKMMDIGCGHALTSVLFWRRYNCDIHLVDIEQSNSTHHDYHDSGSGYASLAAAKEFLVSNGVPENRIAITNPMNETLESVELDLILSTFSAGFHYPISTYTKFALKSLKPGGMLIFDARDDTGQDAMLAGFDPVKVVSKGLKHRKLAAFNPKA